jgi:membrane associated rhomboid family serine protease
MHPENSQRRTPMYWREVPAWVWLVWAAGAVFFFNAWVAQGLGWTDVLHYEVPGRVALAQGHLWTLLTYVLLGGGSNAAANWLLGPLSIVLLFVAARLVENELPARQFLLLGAGCALAGAALWLPLHWAHDDDQLLSGSVVLVLGLLSFWCFTAPDEPMPVHFFFIGEARPQIFFWLALALETGSFLCFELPQALGWQHTFQFNFDNSAHLGGMLAGWLGARWWNAVTYERLADAIAEERPARREPPAAVSVGAARAAEEEAGAKPGGKPTATFRRELREEVDRILDKINRDGFGALSPKERQTLDRAKEFLRK